MYLHDLTTEEVAALERDLVVVVPFAAIEQHGPHLPIGTDSIITEGICRRLDARDPRRCLWTPVVRLGSSSHHMPFAGTLTLSSRTFLDVAREVVECLFAHGFRRFVLLNGHGGNQALLDVAVQEIRLGLGRVAPDSSREALRVVHATYWVIAREAFAAIRESATGGMGHACEMETSVLLALEPSLVRRYRAERDGSWARSEFEARDMLSPGRVGEFLLWSERSRHGVLGDPTSASAEKGARFLDAACDALERVIADLAAGRLG